MPPVTISSKTPSKLCKNTWRTGREAHQGRYTYRRLLSCSSIGDWNSGSAILLEVSLFACCQNFFIFPSFFEVTCRWYSCVRMRLWRDSRVAAQHSGGRPMHGIVIHRVFAAELLCSCASIYATGCPRAKRKVVSWLNWPCNNTRPDSTSLA